VLKLYKITFIVICKPLNLDFHEIDLFLVNYIIIYQILIKISIHDAALFGNEPLFFGDLVDALVN